MVQFSSLPDLGAAMARTSPDLSNMPEQRLEDANQQIDAEKIEQTDVVSLEWKKTEKSLVRKLDMTLIPVVWVLYMFNYLDRNNIAYAEPASPICMTCV